MPHLCKLVALKKTKPPSDLRMKRSMKPKKTKSSDPKSKLFLPFVMGMPKLPECRVCENVIYPKEEVCCSMKNCKVSYHSRCASDRLGVLQSSKDIKCPQHACFHCKKKSSLWRCSICDLASHDKCAPFPKYCSKERPSDIICWRHSIDSPPSKHAVPTSSIREVFDRLPVPYVEKDFEFNPMSSDIKPNNLVLPSVPISSIEGVFRFLERLCVEEEFKIDPKWKHMAKDLEPPSYVHIKRNIYRVKNKGYDVDHSTGCTSCSDVCYEDCMCRYLHISCTSACKCSENCTNRPFLEDKKVKVVMTQHCGWGVEAAQCINKGDYIIEYVGEAINDALCEKRFWDMKGKGVINFYVVAVRKDFNIDAQFKGNESRFINHSCDPNCVMEKWDVNGETRLGLFAAKSIEPKEELTFDYGYKMYSSDEIVCHCGASNCRGYLGAKRLDVGATTN